MRDITESVVELLGIGQQISGSSSLSGSSDLVSAITLRLPAGAQLSGESDLVSALRLIAASSSGISAESDLVSSAFLLVPCASSISAESDLVSSAFLGLSAGSSLDADSLLVADAIVISAPVNMSAESDLIADAIIEIPVDSHLLFESDLSSLSILALTASSSMSAEASLTITVNVVNLAASVVIGSSDLVANASRIQSAAPRPMSVGVTGTFSCTVAHPVAARPFVASSALTATIYTNPRLLVLPTVEYAYTNNVLLRRYPIDNGQALVITDGVGELLDFPAQQIIAQADYYFPGGKRVELDPTEEAAVVAAGYGEYIETEFLS